MKKMFVAAVLVAAFACVGAAQKVGGYKEISVSDAGVSEAAEFAVTAQGEKTDRTVKLIKVRKAEVQIVAGRNYRMCLKVGSTGGEDEADAIFTVVTVVYVDLKGNKKLSGWEPTDCGDDEDGDD